MAYSTINKIGIVLKTLRECPQELPGPSLLQPNGKGLQIHGPGLQKTWGRLQKSDLGAQDGLQHHQ
jgi:hypothetical protein